MTPSSRGCARCSTRRGWAGRVCVLGGISGCCSSAISRRVVGAGDCVAGGRFSESAVLPGPGCDRGVSGSLDAVTDASADRCGDARSGFHVGSGAVVRGRSGAGEDGRRRCDDAGSERGDAEHRAAGHRGILRGFHSAVGRGVRGGGLVFIGATTDRRFRAFDSRTGEELSSAAFDYNVEAVPITYAGNDGRQYVAANVSAPATGELRGNERLVVFALP